MKKRFSRLTRSIKRRMLGIQIFYKILIIQIIIGVAQGAVTLFQIQSILNNTHEKLGICQEMVENEILVMTQLYFISLSVSMLMGTVLFLILTHFLMLPIRKLLRASKSLMRGDLKTRIKIIALDEIGKLGLAFNRMATSIERFHLKMMEKENARISLIDQIVIIQERDRKQIARELHDQLGQSLSALLLEIKTCSIECVGLPILIGKLEKQIIGMMDDVHRLAWDLRPSILDDYGLNLALERYCQETSKKFNLPIDYESNCTKNSKQLPDRIIVNLYRIAQESILNTVRHSQATRVSVVLLQQKEEIILITEDNGIGLNLKSLTQKERKPLGIIGMQERTTLLGGNLQIESSVGQGTMIQVKIPLQKDVA